jgi:HSP20 family protein
MPNPTPKPPAKSEEKRTAPAVVREREPFDRLRHQIDRLFDDAHRSFRRLPFGRSLFDAEPFWRHEMSWGNVPAVDVAEQEKEYLITAELPGMDEGDIELKLSGDTLMLKGEKTGEKEEKKKDYYLSERRHGAFQRTFRIPEGVDADKIQASFKKGVLTITLPKTTESLKQEKRIAVTGG